MRLCTQNKRLEQKKCLQTFYASTRGPSVSNPVHLLGMNNKIKNSFVIESVRDQTDAAASDCISFGDILGLASVLNLLRSFLLLKVRSFLLSLYEELLSTMFERLLGSSGIVAGEVVLHLYLGPTIPLGLAARRPALASTCDSILVCKVDPPRAAAEWET